MGGDILRAVRPSGVHERVARARRTWGELSLAEQIAIAGIGGLGGLGALTAARLLLGPRGDETPELLDRYAKAGAKEKDVIAGLCTSRVHELRDLLLDPKRAKVAGEILRSVQERLESIKTRTSSQIAMIEFIDGALTHNSFGTDHSEWVEVRILDDEHAAKETRILWGYQRVPDKSFKNDVHSFLDSGKWESFYGHIATWDVRDVRDMAEAFSTLSVIEPLDLSFWDTRGVTSMRKMFSEFQGNANVETWDTRNVTDMSHMFQNATQLDADLSGWKTGSVRTMQGMFSGAARFDCQIGNWDTRNVTDMSAMFNAAESFNGNLSGWHTGSVRTMSRMFSGAGKFNGSILKWDTSKVTDMRYMFAGAKRFNGDIRTWDTRNVRSMKAMFLLAKRFDQDIGGWKTGNVADMTQMFCGAKALNRRLKWDTRSVQLHNDMFAGALNMAEENQPEFLDSAASHDGAASFGGRQGGRAYL